MQDEHGGVAVLIGVLFMAVFVAFTALVVDAGAAFQERRELQNAADAGALAIAYACARGDEPCDQAPAPGSWEWVLAETLANQNASDGMATVTDVRYDGNRVTVETESLNGEGAHFFQWLVEFSRNGLFGDDADDIDPITVVASATVTIEPVGSGSGLPLTFGLCEWYTNFDEEAPVEPPFNDPGTVITFHDLNADTSCPAGPAGADYPGGFGWLTPAGDCEADVHLGPGNDGKTGNPTPTVLGCSGADLASYLYVNSGEPVLIPLFVEVDPESGPGDNATYNIAGFGAIYLTGYRFPGNPNQMSYPTSNPPCPSSTSCISGHFAQFVPFGNAGGGGNENFGATIPRLTD